MVLDTKMVPFGKENGDKSIDGSAERVPQTSPNHWVFPWQVLEFGVVPGPGAFQCSSSQGGSPSLDQGPMVMAGVAQHPWIVSDDPYGILRYYIHTYTYTYWVWVNTYRYIFSGMNIHLPAILMFTRGTRF